MKTFVDFGRPATVKEVADRMGEVPAKVYYHVKKLESIGLVSIDHTEVINGIVAKYYLYHDGEIEIQSAEIEPEMRGVYWSNVNRMLAQQFDQVKEKFLRRTGGSSAETGRFMQNALHMTQEEAHNVFRQLNELLEPYKHREPGENRLPYDIFIAMGADKINGEEGELPKQAKTERPKKSGKTDSKKGSRADE
ncbi:hypothetical protein B9G55_07295 [Saccharibacillus sp. O16]|nr:hypothetical protein B9G55_07295 [Saccharibacillus sp. O16]